MKEGRQYVPIDSRIAFGKTGTKLAELWGAEGIGVWMLYLAACKRANPQGTLIFNTDEEAWRDLGAKASGFTLTEFFRATGQMKQTRRTRSGRTSYVLCTQWGEWNKDWKRQTQREQKSCIRAQTGADTLATEGRQTGDTRATGGRPIQRLETDSEKGSTARTRRSVEKPASQQNDNGTVVEIYAVQELLKVLSDKDEGTAAVIASFHRKLSEGAFHYVRDRIREYEPHSPSAFAVAALSSMVQRGEYARVRAS